MRFIFFGVLFAIVFETFSYSENCGKTQRPLGLVRCGEETRPGDFPWLVGIFNKGNQKFVCNGHLISKRHVITDEKSIEDEFHHVHKSFVFVIVGQHNLEYSVEESQKFGVRTIHRLTRSFWVPNFRLLILTLDKSVTPSKTVQLICLSFSSCIVDCFETLVGWERNEASGKVTAIPKQEEINGKISLNNRVFEKNSDKNEKPCEELHKLASGLYSRQGSSWILVGIFFKQTVDGKTCTYEFSLIQEYQESIVEVIKSETASKEISLNCKFEFHELFNVYTCHMKEISEVNEPEVLAVKALGSHLENYADEKVLLLVISHIKSSYLPNGVGILFENLESFWIVQTKTRFLDRKVFRNMKHLKYLKILSVPIKEIRREIFSDLSDLRSLEIRYTHITKLHVELLVNLRKLEFFYAQDNQIEQIDKNLFKNCPSLTQILLNGNKIEKIYENFHKITNLKRLDLRQNVCIDDYCDDRLDDKCASSEIYAKILSQCREEQKF